MHYILDTLGNSGPVSNVHFRWTWGFLGLYSGPESGCSWVCILGILGLYSGCSRAVLGVSASCVLRVYLGCARAVLWVSLGVHWVYLGSTFHVYSGCSRAVLWVCISGHYLRNFPSLSTIYFCGRLRTPTIYFHYLPTPIHPICCENSQAVAAAAAPLTV